MWIFSAIANAVGRNFIGSPNYLYDLIFNRAKAEGGVTEAQQCTIDQISYIEKTGLLSQASLLVTPTSYKEGKLYADLPINGNGDFTATRATTATRVNSAGLVDLVPYNLLQYSEDLTQAIWGKVRFSATANTTTAPDGTLTADTISMTAVGSLFRAITQVVSGTTLTYTLSVYLKYVDRQYIQLTFDGAFSGSQRVNIDLLNGVITADSMNGGSTLTSVGNGWYKLQTTSTGVNTQPNTQIWAIDTDNAARAVLSTGTGSYYIWGAQLVEGTSARDYLRTETRLNIPRVDYSLGGCPNILLEPQRTNLALQSSSFDNASWFKNAASITINSTTSPSGITDADTLTADGTLTFHQASQSVSVTSGITYTWSVYAKKNTNNFIQLTPAGTIFGTNVWANFDLNNGVVGSVGSSTTASIQNVGNGWYRCIITGAATATASGTVAAIIVTSATSPRAESNTLNTSVFLWGAQLEAGAYATSYIPTTTASVTRNADSITRNNIFTNGLITAAGGTWFVELRNNVARVRDAVSRIAIGDTNTFLTNSIVLLPPVSSNRVAIAKTVAGTLTTLYNTTTDTCKIAIKWNGSTADVFVNGIKVVTASSFTTTNMDFFGNSGTGVPYFINEMALFPTPLTDAQMSMLTSGIYPTAAAAYASLGLVSESPSCLTSTTTF